MKYFKKATFFLLTFVTTSFAMNFDGPIASVASTLEMHRLCLTQNSPELNWFTNRSHITEKIFFFNLFMSEMKKPDSFPENRINFAKYGMRRALTMSESDQLLVDPDMLRTCFDILAKNESYDDLFELTVKLGEPMIILFELLECERMKALTEALFVSSFRDQFIEIVKNHQRASGFKGHLYSEMILSDIPQNFYVEYLSSNPDVAVVSTVLAISKGLHSNRIDFRKIEKIFDLIRIPKYQEFFTAIKEDVDVINSPHTVTLADTGINFDKMENIRKLRFVLNAGNYSKDNLLEELVESLEDSEKFALLKSSLAISKEVKPSGLKLAVKIYNLLSEEIRAPINETIEYLQAAVNWLKLDKLEAFDEGEYSYQLTFKADSRQVADGLFRKMIYRCRRNSSPNFRTILSFGYSFNFVSTKALKSVISQDLPSIFPELEDRKLPISKNTLKLFAADENLKSIATQRGYKLIISEITTLLEFIKESSLTNVPKMGNLIEDSIVTFHMIASISTSQDLLKLEKFTQKSIADLIQNALTSLKRPATEVDYFKIRNAVVYWMNGPDRLRLNELPELMKKMIVKELPEMSEILTF